VVSGKIHLKFTPWKSSKYLDPHKDYEHYDFRSPVDPWSHTDGSPLQFVEAEAHAGQIIYLPPYWWFSIRYMGEEPTYVCVQTYHSLMNWVAHAPDLALSLLQRQNITKTYKKAPAPLQEENEIVKEDIDVDPKEATIQLTENLITQ